MEWRSVASRQLRKLRCVELRDAHAVAVVYNNHFAPGDLDAVDQDLHHLAGELIQHHYGAYVHI